MAEQQAKFVGLNAKHQELTKAKAACEGEIASNNQKIEQANKDLEKLRSPEVLEQAKADAVKAFQAKGEEQTKTQGLCIEAQKARDACQAKLNSFEESMQKMETLQKSGNDLCSEWETKMRKHTIKRKKLVAQSSTFDDQVDEIKTRIGEEKDQWSEVLKPLITEAIAELTKLQNQLQ